MSKNSGLYETDFYAWTIEQAKFLKDGVWDCLDISNLVEEIEWGFQPSHRSKSWLATIREQRRRIGDLLEESPSLKPYLPEVLEKAYQDGVDLAVRETSLDYKDFPQECLYSLEQVLDFSFFPGKKLDSYPNLDGN
jgi:hypothetical protein